MEYNVVLKDSRSSFSWPSNTASLFDFLCILCAWLVPLLLIHPFQNFPFIDDWTYAWPVEQLLAHQRLMVLEWSSSPNFTQAIWGYLFCLYHGFSYANLRFSIWLLALGCLWGLYLLLREFQIPRMRALLGTATLGFNPIFFSLSFSFMTDIPFITLEVWAILCMTLGFKTERALWYMAAAVFGALSFTIRPVGIAYPAAITLFLVLRRERFKCLWLPVIIFISILSAGITAYWWLNHQVSTAVVSDFPGIPKTRLAWLNYAIPSLPYTLPSGLVFVCAFLGINLLPLTMAAFDKKLILKYASIFGAMLLLFLVVQYCHIKFTIPLSTGSIWEWSGFWASRELVPNEVSPDNPKWLLMLTLLGLLSMAIVICNTESRNPPFRFFIMCLCCAHFLLIVILWLFHDRYAMVIIPFIITLYLSSIQQLRVWVAAVLLAFFTSFSLVGMHNTLNYNDVLWKCYTTLRKSGADYQEIDGGYVVNGWQQYAHPEHAPRDEDGSIFIPGMTTSDRYLKYRISNQPQTGYKILEKVTYSQWLRREGNIYILQLLSQPASVGNRRKTTQPMHAVNAIERDAA